jgi:ADP-ribose pyrophosphatase YjhB (NUDIX family)
MQTYICKTGCCKIQIKTYKHQKKFHRNYRKAGVFIYDPKQEKVLLVQSRGHLWGPPKGSLNFEEQDRNCAVREVKEETGLNVSYDDFTKAMKISKRAIFYYLEMDACDIKVQDSIENNDANGITWIKISCLEKSIKDGNIVLNNYAKLVFAHFLNKVFPKSTWIKVGNKKNKK